MSKITKIRINAWDRRADGQTPATGIPIVLEATVEKATQFLGTLATNRYGYVSFDLSQASQAATEFKAYVLGSPNMAITIKRRDLATGNDHFHMPVSVDDIPGMGNFAHLPAIQQADYKDYQLAPGDLIVNPSVQIGSASANARPGTDRCSRLVPNPEKYREYGIRQLVWDEKGPKTLPMAEMSDCFECVPEKYRQDKLCIRNGEALDYRVKWTFLGHSLGELINSFTLAPCEQVRIATLDWERQDRLRRQEQSTVREEVRQLTNRNFLLQETMDASISEKSLGLSASVSLPIGNTPIMFGGSVSGQISRRDIASDYMQALNDSVVKSASAVRTNNATLVVEAGQQESSVVQSRVIKNNNQCHTLNLFYYEVMRHYQVQTSYESSCKVIYVEYCPREFSPEEVAGYAHIFRPALLDPSLDECFDALARYIFCCKDKDDNGNGSGGDEACQVKTSSIRVTISIGKNKPGKNADIKVIIKLKNGSSIAVNFPTPNNGLASNTTTTATISLGQEICASDINGVGIDFDGKGLQDKMDLNGLVVQYNPSSPQGLGGPFPIYSNGSINTRVDEDEDWSAGAKPTIPEVPKPAPVPGAPEDPCVADECCAERLMNHMRQNSAYYNSVYWMNEDATERGIRFSQFNYNGQPLISQIMNNPVGVVGNWVAFLEADCDLAPDPSIKGCESIVYLPTRGIFGEGILGACGTCEKPDPDEHRDFKCDCDAPEITRPTPENQTGALAGLTPTVPGNIVQIGGLEASPTANLPGQLAELLKANGLFNDLTGLSNLQAMLKKLEEELKNLKDEQGGKN